MKFEIKDVRFEPCVESEYIRPKRIRYIQNGKEKFWDVVETHQSVALLIYETDTQRFVIVKQFRPAVYLNNQDGITYELCAGLIDKDKTPQEIAKEEALEECGYDIPLKNIKKITSYYTAVGFSGGRQYLYLAEVDSSHKVSKGGGVDEEEIEVIFLPKDKALEFLFDENYAKSPGLLFGIMWYLSREKVVLNDLFLDQAKSAMAVDILNALFHQWKQPLSTISLLAGQLPHRAMLNKLDTSSIEEISNSIIDSVSNIDQMIDMVKSFYDKRSVETEFDIKDTIYKVKKILGFALNIKGIDLQFKIKTEKKITSIGDEKLLIQALLSILLYRRDAILKNGIEDGRTTELVVYIYENEDGIEITIKDYGVGMSKEVVDKFFSSSLSIQEDKDELRLILAKAIVENQIGGILSLTKASNPTIFNIIIPRKHGSRAF